MDTVNTAGIASSYVRTALTDLGSIFMHLRVMTGPVVEAHVEKAMAALNQIADQARATHM